MIWTLDEVEKHAKMVEGMWNGDNSGMLEDAAHAATELLEHLTKVRECLEEIEDIDESDVVNN